MERLISKKEGDKQHIAVRIQNAVISAKLKDGTIDINKLNKLLDSTPARPFTHPIGGLGNHGAEYYNNAELIVTGHGLLRGVSEGAKDLLLADASIFLPTRRRWKEEEKTKKLKSAFVQELGIPNEIMEAIYSPANKQSSGKTVAFAKDRIETRIPLQRKYIELATRIHNRIMEDPELRNAVKLFAVVGGAFTRNIATIPVKVRLERRDKKLNEPEIYTGVIPDFDPFIILSKNASPQVKRKIIELMREEARKIGILRDLDHELLDTSRDIFAYEDEFEKIAHSLHDKKPKVIFHGMEIYESVRTHPEFQKYAKKEEEQYVRKLQLIADAVISEAINKAIKTLVHLAKSGEISKDDLHRVVNTLKENFSKEKRLLISHANVQPMIDDAIKDYDQKSAAKILNILDTVISNQKKFNRLLRLAMGDKETSRIMNMLMLSMGAVPKLSKRAQRAVLAAAALALIEGREKLGRNIREYRLAPLSPKVQRYTK